MSDLPRLIRATIPMCPECGAMVVPPLGGVDKSYACNECKFTTGHASDLDWGYFAPDIAGVVGEMKSFITTKCDEAATITAWITDWVARLEDSMDWVDRMEGKQ